MRLTLDAEMIFRVQRQIRQGLLQLFCNLCKKSHIFYS
jgi:hypothetical protein